MAAIDGVSGVEGRIPDLAGRAPARRRMDRSAVAAIQYVVVVGGTVWLIYRSAAAMQYQWQWPRVLPLLFVADADGVSMGPLALGLIETLRISTIAMVIALLLGLALAIARLSSSWSAAFLAGGIIGIVRNTPLIVQISMFYFVVAPSLGIGRFWAGVLSLSLFEAVFVAEIVRSGILAIPAGQWEAGAALGLRRAAVLRLIVLPQVLRIMLPPLTGAAVSLVKNSSIVSVIALFELTTAGRDAISNTYMSFEIWLTVAAIYLALTLSLSMLVQTLERHLSRPFAACRVPFRSRK